MKGFPYPPLVPRPIAAPYRCASRASRSARPPTRRAPRGCEVPEITAERSRSAVLGPAGGATALLLVEDDLADAHGLRGHLDALVVAAELQGLLQGELARRDDRLERVGGGGAHVGE